MHSRPPSDESPVVIACSRLPLPIRSGLDLRTLSIARALSSTRPVGLFALTGSDHIPGLQTAVYTPAVVAGHRFLPPEQVVTEILSGDPKSLQAPADDGALRALRDFISHMKARILVISRIDMAPYLDAIEEEKGVTAVLDLDEVQSELLPSIAMMLPSQGHRLLFLRYSAAIASLEADAIERFSHIWVSSPAEVERVGRNYPGRQPHLVPNSIDVATYARPSATSTVCHEALFPANFGYRPNIDAARFITDELLPRTEQQRFVLAGNLVPDWLRTRQGPRVRVVEDPADMRPLFWTARVTVVPLKAGGGSRLKILESMASSTPVISTAVGASGLDISPGRHFLEAETAEEFLRCLEEVVVDPTAAQSLADAALTYVQEAHSLESLARHLAEAVPR